MLHSINNYKPVMKFNFLMKIIGMRFSENLLLIITPQLIAFWSVWLWYIRRLTDISDEPVGIIALATVLLILFYDNSKIQIINKDTMVVKCQDSGRIILLKRLTAKNKQEEIIDKKSFNFYIPTALIILFAVSNNFLPDILKAALAFLSLSYTIGFYKLKNPFNLSVTGLFLLSLPVIASLQFYFGYPIRAFTTMITTHLLKLNGLFVVQDGTCLKWGNHNVCLDAPCSGIQMLWTGLYLCFTIALIYKLNLKQTILSLIFSIAVIILGNIIRATSLFYTESKIFNLPDFTHQGIGIVMFVFMAVSIGFFSQYIKNFRGIKHV